MKNKKTFLSIFLVLIFAALACNAGINPPAIPTGLPSIPTLDPNLSDKFEEEWQKSLVEALATGNFEVTITEGQLTEFVNRKNSENPNSALSNIQVFLRDGQIQLYSAAENETGSATLQITASVSVNADGKLQADVISAQLGPFPVPEQMLEGLSNTLNDALSGQGTEASGTLQIETVEISDGFMTISGKIK
jgi:hypothetical protein